MILVTGKKGEAHVTSLQHRNIIASLCGSGSYVGNLYNKLAATISGNTLTIQSGVLIHHGCVMQVDYGTTDTLALTAGTAGYYRLDKVVARWTQDSSTGVESVEWVLIQGTPTADYTNVPIPTHNTGNMQEGALIDDCVVYTITYNGTSATVARQINVIEGVSSLLDISDTVSALLTSESYSSTPSIASGDNTLYVTFSQIPRGYSPVAIKDVSTAGTGSSYVRIRGFGISSDGSQAYIKLHNESSNTLTGVTINVGVLFANNDVIL